jgi:hypothetical protein
MPKIIKERDRVVSKNTIPAGKNSCNSKLKSRDGYCQSPGVTNFHRCPAHGGKLSVAAMDLFKSAVGIDQAAKLQTLVEDTLSMDNELASGKTMLLQELEDYRRASHVLEEYQGNAPSRPHPDATIAEIESYNSAVNLHIEMMNIATKTKEQSFKRAHALIRTLSTGIHRNSRIKEGSKFQLDAKQVASLLKVQLDVMRVNCKGCPSLKKVIQGIKEGVNIIPIDGSISEANKKAMGAKAYGQAFEAVSNAADGMPDEPIDADAEILD